MLNTHAALIYTMVITSAADEDMTDAEFKTMGAAVQVLPIFDGFDQLELPGIAASCGEMLAEAGEDGLDTVLKLIKDSLSPQLRETAYALACDIAASDGRLEQEEIRLLEILRHQLDISRLSAAAIEAGTRARYTRI